MNFPISTRWWPATEQSNYRGVMCNGVILFDSEELPYIHDYSVSLDLSLCVMVESRGEEDGERETEQRAWMGSQLDMDKCSRKLCATRYW